MNAKQRKASGAAMAGLPSTPLADVAQDFPRQQMAVCAEATCAVLQGFEHLRGIQAQAAHQALQRHQAAVDQLLRPCDPAAVMAIQTHLVSENLQESLRYWMELGHAAMEMNQQVMARLGQWGGPGAVEGIRSATDVAAALSGLGELFQRTNGIGAQPH
jgi:hypothetical protein